MRATIDWSYTLLDAAEQRAFRRLGAFVGGWNLASAAAVIGCGPCLETITALVDKSLVYQINQPERTADDEPRFTMLETLREYAIEQLTRHGDAAETYAEHAAYFLTLAERARPQLDTDSAPAWVAQLACEHDNLRAALTWSVATPNRVELGARLAHLLISFWWRTEHLHEAQRWLELLLANSGKSVAAIRAALLRDLASVVSPLGNHRAAQAWLEESLALAQELDDKPGIGTTLHLLSEVAFTAGDSRRGVALAEEALPLLRASGDAATVAGVLDDLARDALHTGETTRGVALLEESLALLRTHGPAWDVADTLETLAKAVRDAGDAPRALRLYQEALRQMQRVGSSSAILGVLASLIPALHEQGDQEAAAMYLRESLSRFGELTPVVADPDALPWQRRNIAHAAYVIGDEACAAALLRVSLQTFSQQPVPARGGIALALQDVAGLLICRGQVAQAVELFGAAQMLQTHVAPWGLGERREYERDVARVRAQLGEESFARAWASGVRLSLEDAIAKAIHALVEDSF
jgi:tetratricopeptide (TPR) repeat protein